MLPGANKNSYIINSYSSSWHYSNIN